MPTPLQYRYRAAPVETSSSSSDQLGINQEKIQNFCSRIVTSYEISATSIRKLADLFQVSKATIHKLIMLKRITPDIAANPTRSGKHWSYFLADVDILLD